MMFAVLFGLSMDYEVFLVSRIKVLLPAVMRLLGEAAWWTPRRSRPAPVAGPVSAAS